MHSKRSALNLELCAYGLGRCDLDRGTNVAFDVSHKFNSPSCKMLIPLVLLRLMSALFVDVCQHSHLFSDIINSALASNPSILQSGFGFQAVTEKLPRVFIQGK